MEETIDDIDTAISERLRSLRAKAGLTLDELAQRSGVSRAMISRIERGEASPTAALLARLSEALGLTLSAFFADDEPATSPLSRYDDQKLWRDPHTGYLRRSVSPQGTPGRVDIVEVDFPAHARVSFPPREESRVMTQHVWLFEGVLEMIIGETVHTLYPGDCLYMDLGDAFDFHNPSDKPARYAVILDRGR
ncbi:helix-turn-helix domain-containing protein [Neorhizobium petrolearium]|uniref:Helix-turn-helix domain-containing protein n=1 Tax=Neorhizobium petrolearium TaxID=515361 RepID=A0ABY8M1L1_9HYPH|nr:helix-turn-helix transcriptional regulator [Neorhizobium petrolearium]MCC2613311.1 helix-turn-helix domain-containing protein [Neorhizobium petrolearium]WGI68397.1 helix-turn-helix domain-containing protein [Neorhizobium petrolearium]